MERGKRRIQLNNARRGRHLDISGGESEDFTVTCLWRPDEIVDYLVDSLCFPSNFNQVLL